MNVQSPEISIIVPVYNVEKYLDFCIKSIIKQTYKNYEVLLIDDGSSDNSSKMCDELELKDDRIKVFHKINGGLSDARNYGIDRASGNFLLFIDSDDVLHPDFCKRLLELQKEHNADIVSCDVTLFSDHNKINEYDNKIYYEEVLFLRDSEILKEYFMPSRKKFIYDGLCMKLYRRELFKNLRFTVGRLHEDLYITHILLQKAHQFVYVNLPYYYYYQNNSNSITKNYKAKNFIDEYDALKMIITYHNDNKSLETALNKFILEQYLFLLYQFNVYLRNEKQLLDKKRELEIWVRNFLKKDKELSFIDKLKKYLRLDFPFIWKIHNNRKIKIQGGQV